VAEPVVIIQGALLDHLDDPQVVAVLGHELGRLHADHTLYRALAGVLASGSAMFGVIGRLLTWPLQKALFKTGLIAHVQFNDRNRRGPGEGEDKFAPVVRALRETGYKGWIAMEPFQYKPDGAACAARAIGYVQGLMEATA
jgi:hypothetical protein